MNFTNSPFERMMKEVPWPGRGSDDPCTGCRYYKECKGRKKQCRKKFRALTRDEKKKIRSLVTGTCANYDRETGLCLLYAAQMLDRGVLPLFPGGCPASRPGASCGADRGRQFLGASGLCGLRTGIFTRRPSSLLFRRLQG